MVIVLSPPRTGGSRSGLSVVNRWDVEIGRWRGFEVRVGFPREEGGGLSSLRRAIRCGAMERAASIYEGVGRVLRSTAHVCSAHTSAGGF